MIMQQIASSGNSSCTLTWAPAMPSRLMSHSPQAELSGASRAMLQAIGGPNLRNQQSLLVYVSVVLLCVGVRLHTRLWLWCPATCCDSCFVVYFCWCRVHCSLCRWSPACCPTRTAGRCVPLCTQESQSNAATPPHTGETCAPR
jgi:hypothetical protein